MQEDERERVIKFIEQSKAGIVLNKIISIKDLIIKYKNFNMLYKKLVNEYENANKTYTYMLTFTIDPKKHDVNDPKLHLEIEDYILKWAVRRTPLRADYVREGTDEDHKHTHWHLGLEMKKYIDFSNFLKFYRNSYGIVDISKSYSNLYKNILKYINKSVPSSKIAT